MLVITRRPGERFVIQTPQGDIWVTLMEMDRGRGRIGIDAPKELAIYRQELLDRIEKKPPVGGE